MSATGKTQTPLPAEPRNLRAGHTGPMLTMTQETSRCQSLAGTRHLTGASAAPHSTLDIGAIIRLSSLIAP